MFDSVEMYYYSMFISQIVLLETSASPDVPIVLEQIPVDLNWKFVSNINPHAPRYWVLLWSTIAYAVIVHFN